MRHAFFRMLCDIKAYISYQLNTIERERPLGSKAYANFQIKHPCIHRRPLLRLSGFGAAVGFGVGFSVGFALANGGDSRFESCVPLRLDPTPPKPPQPSQPSVASSLFAGLVTVPPRLGSANGGWERVRATVNKGAPP